LGAILPGLADFPAKRVAELAPLAWGANPSLIPVSFSRTITAN